MKHLPIFLKILLFIPFIGIMSMIILNDTISENPKTVSFLIAYHFAVISIFLSSITFIQLS
jgi:hypothetical protein